MAKKNVLFIINTEVGGSERMSVNISKMLPQTDFCIKYVIIKDAKLKRHATSIVDFIPQNAELLILNAKGHFDKVIKLYKVIKHQSPDIVFSSHYNINDKILFLKPFLPYIKFIIRAENTYSTFSKSKKSIIRKTYCRADVLIAQTTEMKNDFVTNGILPTERIIVLENPVDKDYVERKLSESFKPYPDDGKKHIVAVGRFHLQKGYDYLIQAFSEVLKYDKEVDLYIVGSYLGQWQKEYERVMQIACNLGIEQHIQCVGFSDNPYVYMKYADCFVLSSRWEGLPNVLVEALYLRTPIAAFKCIPIIERMVRNGIDGYLAEKESVPALTKAICFALNMGRTNPAYCGATEEDFVALFK